MCSSFHDPAVIEHYYLITVTDSWKPVCYDYTGYASFFDRIYKIIFCFGIKGTCCLIKNVKVEPKPLVDLYKNKREVTKEAKLPLICLEVMSFVPYPKTTAIPKELYRFYDWFLYFLFIFGKRDIILFNSVFLIASINALTSFGKHFPP